MRKVVLGSASASTATSPVPDGAVDFLFMPKDYSMGPFFATVDEAIMGRKTYEVGLKLGGGSLPKSKMAMYVFSHSHAPGKRGASPSSTNPRKLSLRSFANALEKTSG